MKKYIKEIVVLILQILVFYVSPLFASTTDAIGMVFLIVIITFVLSIILGIVSNEKVKIFYPIIVAILFVPSIFIYYNDSALIHSIWYLIISSIGLMLGTAIQKTFKKPKFTRRNVYEK